MAATAPKRDSPSLELVAHGTPEALITPPCTPSSTPQARHRVLATPQQTPRRPNQASPAGALFDWRQKTPSARETPRVAQQLATPERSSPEAFQETPFPSIQSFRLESTPQKTMDQRVFNIGMRTPKQVGARACSSIMTKTPKGEDSGQRSPLEGGCPFVAISPEFKKAQRMTPPTGICPLQSKQEAEIGEALREGSLMMLELALSGGHGCGSGYSVYEAVRLQHFRALQFLLTADTIAVDDPCCGRRPLHSAVRACRTHSDPGYRMAEMLLQHGSKPDRCACDDISQAPPLHNAAGQGIAPAVTLLLRYGADPNAGDAKGFTPLHVVCQNASVGGLLPPPPTLQQTATALLVRTAEGPGASGAYPMGIPLQTLICQRHMQVVELLLQNGASPVALDQAGLAPGHYACDERLRGKLARAARWWRRRMLTLVRGSGRDADGVSTNACFWRALLPEVVEAVITFL